MAARALLFLGLLAAACESTAPPPPDLTPAVVRERFFPRIEDGLTTVRGAEAAFGAPFSFEGGRLAVWRLLLVLDAAPMGDAAFEAALDQIVFVYANPHDPRRPVYYPAFEERRRRLLSDGAMLAVGRDGPPAAARHLVTREAEFDLVLVFGPDGVLRKQSLVRVGP